MPVMGGMWVLPTSEGNGEALAPTRWGQEAGPWGGDQVRGGPQSWTSGATLALLCYKSEEFKVQ